jgi:hypothetical protein
MTTINFRSKFIIGEKGGLRRNGGCRERRGAESAPVAPRHPVRWHSRTYAASGKCDKFTGRFIVISFIALRGFLHLDVAVVVA